MNTFIQLWQRMGTAGRIGFAVASCLVIGGTAALGTWLLRTDYQVLFSDLAQRDSAAMVAELERMKVPYRLDDGGAAILVPADQVYKTRLKLTSKDLPLQGAIGFELFNNSDVGMTDFAQKVNYQRALQGELTRTILSMEEVQSARVHLALAENGLFRKTGAQSKASVALTMKRGQTLGREQVRGIQRLVAAAVPEIKPDDVTVVDQRGVPLNHEAGKPEDIASGSGFETKRDLEDYLGRKVAEVLDHTFGPGQSVARVDVVLTQDQTRVTTESVLPANALGRSGQPAGVVVREQETIRDSGARLVDAAGASGGGTSTRDIHYQVGRRVEQVVSGPGAISRLNVAVVVKRPLDAQQTERIKALVATAVGLDKMRGDGVVVQSLEQFAGGAPEATAKTAAALPAEAPATPASRPEASGSARASGLPLDLSTWQLGVLAVFTAACAVAMTWAMVRIGRNRRLAGASRGQEPVLALQPEERAKVLEQVRGWLSAPATKSAGGTR